MFKPGLINISDFPIQASCSVNKLLIDVPHPIDQRSKQVLLFNQHLLLCLLLHVVHMLHLAPLQLNCQKIDKWSYFSQKTGKVSWEHTNCSRSCMRSRDGEKNKRYSTGIQRKNTTQESIDTGYDDIDRVRHRTTMRSLRPIAVED